MSVVIRYDIDFDELAAAIDAARPSWRTRAKEAVARMWAASPRSFDGSGPSWSEIKTLYIARQAHKCAYCERTLEAEDCGLVEHDVEHYRPKREVAPWSHDPLGFGVADGNPRGYCMLAYELRNYCVACKTCNSALKRSYFPIEGGPGRADARDITKLNQKERPMIPYPLGRLDEDPERILDFGGFLPKPRFKSGRRYRRAIVTIRLLRLGDRLELLQGRCRVLTALYRVLRAAYGAGSSDEDRADAKTELTVLLSGSQPHTNCARAFCRLFVADPRAARAVYREARALLERTSN